MLTRRSLLAQGEAGVSSLARPRGNTTGVSNGVID
jgi:hypothetical protein